MKLTLQQVILYYHKFILPAHSYLDQFRNRTVLAATTISVANIHHKIKNYNNLTSYSFAVISTFYYMMCVNFINLAQRNGKKEITRYFI